MYPFGIYVVNSGQGYVVRRHGRLFWARTFRTESTARTWARKAVEECKVDPMAGLHFADSATRAVARWEIAWRAPITGR